MGKFKVKSANAGGALIDVKKKSTLGKQKTHLVKEGKKLAFAAKSSLKPKKVSTPSPAKVSKKRKLEESPLKDEDSPKKIKNVSPKKVTEENKNEAEKPTKNGKKATTSNRNSEAKTPTKKDKKKKAKAPVSNGEVETPEKEPQNAEQAGLHMTDVDRNQLFKSENDRRHEQDLRTLFIRFKNKKTMQSEADVYKVHPKIKHVRIYRRRRKKNNNPILFAFIEFESQKIAQEAHKDISPKSDDYFVDFMGPDSKTKRNKKDDNAVDKKKKNKTPSKINPLRLFVNGISSGITQSVLMELFPKASKAVIPKSKESKKSKFAFLDFKNPVDAKAAFDAAKDLSVNGHHITVLYARYESKSTNKKEVEEGGSAEVKKAKKQKQKEEISAKDDEEILDEDNEKDEEGSDVENDEEASDVENDDEEGSDVENDDEGSDIDNGDEEGSDVENDDEEGSDVENDDSEDDE
eukprot:TRINITY_DN4999_c0_g1_i1.p1 TRINITY_DN4999_c0_g1~~TRINITY_DN4999_c0_g1_i1.p1  ORF type:complete len:463 (-),score=172.43 TRINITY_DN4999_c0_g1_i1:160-1548(-)